MIHSIAPFEMDSPNLRWQACKHAGCPPGITNFLGPTSSEIHVARRTGQKMIVNLLSRPEHMVDTHTECLSDDAAPEKIMPPARIAAAQD
jgi:hypothetical protein